MAVHSTTPTCTCGALKEIQSIQEKERVFQFLMGLNETYSHIRSQILAMDPLPTVSRAFAIINQEEKQRLLHLSPSVTADSVAFVADMRLGTNYSHTTGQSKEKPTCAHCGLPGHVKAKCYKLVGYPAHYNKSKVYQNTRKNSSATQSMAHNVSVLDKSDADSQNVRLSKDQYQQLLFILQERNASNNLSGNVSSSVCNSAAILSPTTWIIDSGASDHMTSSTSSFTSYKSTPNAKPVKLPTGDVAPISHIGSVHLSNDLHVNDVLCVPNFQFNLLSVNKLTQSLNCAAIFFPTFCVFQDLHSKKLIGMGEVRDGLYHLTQPSPTPFSAMPVISSSPNLWHMRLGHPSPARLSKLSSNSDVIFPFNSHCDVCHLAKQTRSPFHLSNNRSKNPFDLIHCDIWGGYRTPSHTGAHYFLTIVDDHSRCTWVYLMRYKSETFYFLKNFCAMVKTQFQRQVCKIRSDNGLEFLSIDRMQAFYHENGMLHQRTCVETPQQNGVAERKHRHLLEVARALRFQAHLPLSFWGECILTATYLINRIPTPNLDGKTPYEKLFQQPPSYGHLRVFGSLCYARTLDANRHKFAPRASKCVFVGYPYDQRGYRVYDLTSKRIFTSRDVSFVETTFPFQDSSSAIEPSSIVLPLPIVDHSQDAPGPVPGSQPPQIAIPTTTHAPTNLRRSQRLVTKPARLTDYVCPTLPTQSSPTSSTSLASTGTLYPLSNSLSYSRFSANHVSFLTTISSHDEPTSFSEAMKHSHWRDAMATEIQALDKNQTWTLQDLPPGKRPIGSKWVYKIKYRADGNIERYKARLVAKGYTQIEGLDYTKTFAPVAKLVTVRCLLAVASIRH